MATTSRRGVFFSALAFTTWGCLPLFWRLLEAASPLDILAHRIVWSLPFAMGLTVLLKKPRVWEIFRSRDTFLSVLLSGSLIGVNWGLYIWAINSGMTVEASLGYYMNPLFTMALGFIFLGERPTRLQWAAIALAGLGIGIRLAGYGKFPLIALSLMATFGFYGLAKKRANLDSLMALGGETLVLAPMALGFILLSAGRGTEAMRLAEPGTCALLLLAGPVTALPLLWFGMGAQSIPLSSVGFFQFISPTLQLLIGIYIFGESFDRAQAVSFGFIWAGLLVYALSYLPAFRRT